MRVDMFFEWANIGSIVVHFCILNDRLQGAVSVVYK